MTTSHAYSTPGTYQVTLAVTDDLGVTSTATRTVTVDAQPMAAFSVPSNPTSPGTRIAFDASSSSDSVGTIAAYAWDFGDGNAGSGASAGHSYATPGRYQVTLIVTNDAGQTDTLKHTVTVDAAPSAAFTTSSAATGPGTAISFNAAGSSDTLGTITSYSWSFGDGATGSGVAPSHAYAAAGTYNARLTVTNDAGQTSAAARTITVYSVPTASFAASPNPVQVGTGVSFNAAGSSETVGTISSYSWRFGDGATGSGVAPSHAYAAAGTYTVTLTVTGSVGLTATMSQAVTVQPPPVTQQPKNTVSHPPPPVTRQALSGSVSSTKRDKLATLLNHGLKVVVFSNTAAKAGFVVTTPVPSSKHAHQHSKREPALSTILRTGALSFAPGRRTVWLRLTPASARKLRAAGKAVLTIKMTLTDVYGRKTTRSVKLTVTR